MRKLQLSIPQPCHENWREMTTAEKGKFCASCQKNVYDFTKSTDREIIDAYDKDKKLCGRFLKNQLERDLILPKERKSFWLASLFFGMISLANTKMNAQVTPKTEQTDYKVSNSEKKTDNAGNETAEKTIRGIVSDIMGPLPGANVIVKETTRGVQTNFDGTYEIIAREGEKLVFSFMGMNDVIKTVGTSTIINTTLTDDQRTLGEVIVGGIKKAGSCKERAYRAVETWFEE